MNSDSIVAKFQELLKIDAHVWAKKSWHAQEDTACQTLFAALNECDQVERSVLLDMIRKMGLDSQLEVFAYRSGKFAIGRSDLENAYKALYLCQSRERLLIEAHLAEFTKALGISSRKLRKELATWRN